MAIEVAEAEVCQLYVRLGVEQQVLRLQVTMDYIMHIVEAVDGGDYLPELFPRLVLRETTLLCYQVEDLSTRGQLRNEVEHVRRFHHLNRGRWN